MVTIQMQRAIRVAVTCMASLPCCTAGLILFQSFQRSEVFSAVKFPQALTTALKDSLYQS